MVVKQQELWCQLSNTHKEFTLALNEFLSKDINRVEILKKELLGSDRSTAIYLLKFTPQEELISLLKELVFLASFSHGSIDTIRQIILSLPKDQVLKNIEQFSEAIIENGTYDEYRRLLELYVQLDRDLAKKLALHALEQNNEDIKEAGEDFLNYLSKEI